MTRDNHTIPLTIELIPKPMWGKNVRKVVSQQTWKELRWALDLDHGACGICRRKESGESLHLHEEWHYDDEARIQKLVALVPLCQYCHEVKHIGRAMKVGDGERALGHLRAVNDWGEEAALKYVHRALALWDERSRHEWNLDLSLLTEYVLETRIHEEWLERTSIRPSNPLEARLWAAELLESDALILDTETTGLPNKHARAEIIEIAILSVTGDVVFDSLIKPKYRIPKQTIAINGITNEDVANSPTFPEVIDELCDVVQGSHLIAYKSAFDCEMLAKTCDMYDLEPPDCEWDCAMWAKYFYSGAWTGRLPGLPKARHRAMGDCQAILELMQKMGRGEGNYYGRSDPDFLKNWRKDRVLQTG